MQLVQYNLLFDGIKIAYLSSENYNQIINQEDDNILIITYCYSGKIAWKIKNNYVCIGPKDFAIYLLKNFKNKEIKLLNDSFEALCFFINLNTFTNDIHNILDINSSSLYNKLCKDKPLCFFAGNEKTENIFQYFYLKNETTLSYQKIKTIELILYLYNTNELSKTCQNEYQAEQIEIIRQIHDQLINNLDKRITIEELSKQYLINPTTLKTLFKSVYGTSLAAHIKEHRMNHAAKLLLETNKSIAEIAYTVGYDSQSKFSIAFKDYFKVLPKEYRKK